MVEDANAPVDVSKPKLLCITNGQRLMFRIESKGDRRHRVTYGGTAVDSPKPPIELDPGKSSDWITIEPPPVPRNPFGDTGRLTAYSLEFEIEYLRRNTDPTFDPVWDKGRYDQGAGTVLRSGWIEFVIRSDEGREADDDERWNDVVITVRMEAPPQDSPCHAGI